MRSITLVKNAQWGGEKHEAGTTHSVPADVSVHVAGKLVHRGFAKETKKCQSKPKRTAQSS